MVLVVAPGKETRGGITSVILSHQSSETWLKWNCKWIESYIDRSAFSKILYFLQGFFKFLYLLPKAKIIHIHFSEPVSAFRKSIFILITKLFTSKKIIVHLHAFSPLTTFKGKYSSLYLWIFEKSTAIVVLSSYWKKELLDVYPVHKKIHVLYNACSSKNINHHEDKRKIVLFAGTLNKRKGYKDLINAFGKISAKHPDWSLCLAGNGEIEQAKQLAKSLNLNEKVLFSGWIESHIKEEIFNTADIFCLPSYAEGFPMAVLDAFSYGLPVVATPVGGLPDILKHGENALVFEPGNINALADNLDRLISDDNLRNKLSQESLNLSKGPFNIETITAKLDIIYENILNKET